MKKFDLEDINFKTRMQKWRFKDTIKLAELYTTDPEKEQRLKELNCICCYRGYNITIAGQAFTNSNCANCNEEMTFSNTNVDKLCNKCAIQYDVCKHCGADMNYKERNKL